MKSGVAFWRALRDVRDIHPCWAHLNGHALKESDLPRPISTEYKSIFDLPSEGDKQQQNQQQKQQQQVGFVLLQAVPRLFLTL
jgi:hypothetical protein